MSGYESIRPFETLVGKTIRAIENREDELIFACSDGSRYKMLHFEDCCESVRIDDIAGDLEDLIDSPVVRAEENSSSDEPSKHEYDESYTWTYYRITTAKGTVVVKWYGHSNGYYSERVNFIEDAPPRAVGAVDPVAAK